MNDAVCADSLQKDGCHCQYSATSYGFSVGRTTTDRIKIQLGRNEFG